MSDRKIITWEQFISAIDEVRSGRANSDLVSIINYFNKLEPAPPKDWTPICFGELNVGMMDCRASLCPFRKDCEEYTYKHHRTEAKQ